MKNEIYEFFEKNLNDIDSILANTKQALENKSVDPRAYILITILGNIEPSHIANTNFPDEIKNKLLAFLKEEENSIQKIMRETKSEYPRLVDLEWKFIGLSPIDQVSIEVIPKILVKLKFNNGENKIFETDFAGFKKLQEEVEEGLNSYNTVYSKRVESFAK
jgi:hypothetical protein